jgi:hypothetical protein
MTRIAADQLITELAQGIELEKSYTLAGIRPRLYFHNIPAGTFYFRFYKDSVMIATYSFTSVSAQTSASITSPYFWVDLSIKGGLPLSGGPYTIKLESDGYTYSPSSWIGWVKDFNYNGNLLGNPQDFSEYPYTIKLIEYGDRELVK